MRSTFFGLSIGYSGLAAQQRALDVTSHNVANANTQGYTRQDVIMEPSAAVKVLEGYVGTGVQITEFRRIRDEFLDIQLRTENKVLGEWETKSDILGKLEVIFNEPSESSLRSVMDGYFESWQNLSKNPESVAVRASVMQSGITLADTFNHMSRQFVDLQEDINNGIEIKIDEINSIGRQIRDMNVQIIKAEADGATANDLRDRRDLLVEQLSKVVDIGVTEDSLGAINVSLGGRAMVARGVFTELRFTDNESDHSLAKIEWLDPLTSNPIGDVRIKGGELQGYLDMRDNMVPRLQSEISELARRVATEVNELHRQGFSTANTRGEDFFVKNDNSLPFSAANIRMNQDIIADTSKIAAAMDSSALSGDGENALFLAQLRSKASINSGLFDPPQTVTGTALVDPTTVGFNQLIVTVDGTTKEVILTPGSYTPLANLAAEIQGKLNAPDPTGFGPGAVSVTVNASNQLVLTSNGTGPQAGIYEISGSAAGPLGLETTYKATFDDYYRSSVAQLGVATLEAERMMDNQTLLTEQLENKRQAISGVSLDEEMTNMIKFQHAYSASARVINAMDEMLDLIVNRLGIVGR